MDVTQTSLRLDDERQAKSATVTMMAMDTEVQNGGEDSKIGKDAPVHTAQECWECLSGPSHQAVLPSSAHPRSLTTGLGRVVYTCEF